MGEPTVQSLERAFDILDILAGNPSGLGLSEVAAATGLPRSTVFRLLGVLRRREFVRKDGEEPRYRLGPGLVELGSRYLNSLELKTESAPAMRELAAAFGTIVFLACRQGDNMVYIDRYDQYASLRTYAIIGQRKPLYSTALGKSLLLDLDEEELRELFSGLSFEVTGPNTHRNLEELLPDLAACRTRDWTVDDQENEAETMCVASPIRDYRGKIVSAISTSWSIAIRPDLDPAKVAARVRRAAAEISANLGWRSR